MSKKIVFLSILFQTISVCFLYAQLKPIPIAPHPSTKEQEDSDRLNHECKYLNKYSVGQRNLFYPFNVAKSIKLVSFDVKREKNGTIYLEGHLPMKRKKLIYSDLIEIKP